MTPKRPIPFAFALEALAEADPSTRPMFGCTAVYVGERIVMILRERNSSPEDNGVWLATTTQHHASLRREFPSLRSIRGGRAVGTAGQVGAERPRNSVGRSAPGDRSGAGPAGLGSQGPSSAERKVGRGAKPRGVPRQSIGVLGRAVTGWQLLPADSDDFESAALRACELVLQRDPRIGKTPKRRTP